MKKTFQFLLLLLLLACVFSACKKDLGNYDYDEANVITITTDTASVDRTVVLTNDSIVAKQNDSLKVAILITQTKPTDNLAYEWIVTQTAASNGNPSQHIVGNEKQLKTKITLSINIYKLTVKVTDRTTGVSFYKSYWLNVDSPPWGGEGWLVLQDQASQGGNDISLIANRDGVSRGTVYSNLYFGANGKKLPAGTNKVAVLNYGTALRIQKLAFYYPNGGLQVRSTDYADSANHTNWFVAPPSTINVQSNSVAAINGQYEVLINNGTPYSQIVTTFTIRTPPVLFGAPMLGSWPSVSPYVFFNGSGQYCTFYDRVNKCFFHFNMSNSTLLPSSQPDLANQHWPAYSGSGGAANLGVTGRGYDLNNIGRDLIYADNAQMSDGSVINPGYYCIFRNTAGDSTFMYQFTSGATGIANNITTGRYFLKDGAANVPGINTASIFAVPAYNTGGVSNVFYYVSAGSPNRIYVCNPSYTGTLPATTTSHAGYTFPAGAIIKTMKVFKSGYANGTVPSTESRVLVVATDETANGNGHNVYFFNLTTVGEINATPAQVYTGFDKIVDIAFKKGLGL